MIILPPAPIGGFEIVAADPPWDFSGNSIANPGRNARRHYPTMSLAEIEAMPVREIVAKDAALFLWITTPFLVAGAHKPIMKAWGFKPSGVAFTWAKTTRSGAWHFGNGFTTRKNTEVCVLGKRGRSLRVDAGVPELLVAAVREHSRKPEEFFDRVERYAGERRRLELFARQRRNGWEAWGNQVGRFATDEAAA